MAFGASASLKVEGLPELKRALEGFTEDFRKRALLAAQREGAKVYVKGLKAAAPVRVGGGGKLIKPKTTRAGRAAAKRVSARIRRAGGGSVSISKRERLLLARDAGGARRLPGYLKASIQVYKVKVGSDGNIYARVGVGPAFYGAFVERKYRKWFKPTVDALSQQVIDATVRRLQQEIDRAAARYRSNPR